MLEDGIMAEYAAIVAKAAIADSPHSSIVCVLVISVAKVKVSTDKRPTGTSHPCFTIKINCTKLIAYYSCISISE